MGQESRYRHSPASTYQVKENQPMRDQHQRPPDIIRDLSEQTLRKPQSPSAHVRAYAQANETYETTTDVVAKFNASATMVAIRSLTGCSHAQLLAQCETSTFRR